MEGQGMPSEMLPESARQSRPQNAPTGPAAIEQLQSCGGALFPTLLRIKHQISLMDERLHGSVPKAVGESGGVDVMGILGVFRNCLDEATAIEAKLAELISE